MTQYEYHSEATIMYMEKYLEEICFHQDMFSRSHASKSTMLVFQALKKQLTFDNQE